MEKCSPLIALSKPEEFTPQRSVLPSEDPQNYTTPTVALRMTSPSSRSSSFPRSPSLYVPCRLPPPTISSSVEWETKLSCPLASTQAGGAFHLAALSPSPKGMASSRLTQLSPSWTGVSPHALRTKMSLNLEDLEGGCFTGFPTPVKISPIPNKLMSVAAVPEYSGSSCSSSPDPVDPCMMVDRRSRVATDVSPFAGQSSPTGLVRRTPDTGLYPPEGDCALPSPGDGVEEAPISQRTPVAQLRGVCPERDVISIRLEDFVVTRRAPPHPFLPSSLVALHTDGTKAPSSSQDVALGAHPSSGPSTLLSTDVTALPIHAVEVGGKSAMAAGSRSPLEQIHLKGSPPSSTLSSRTEGEHLTSDSSAPRNTVATNSTLAPGSSMSRCSDFDRAIRRAATCSDAEWGTSRDLPRDDPSLTLVRRSTTHRLNEQLPFGACSNSQYSEWTSTYSEGQTLTGTSGSMLTNSSDSMLTGDATAQSHITGSTAAPGKRYALRWCVPDYFEEELSFMTVTASPLSSEDEPDVRHAPCASTSATVHHAKMALGAARLALAQRSLRTEAYGAQSSCHRSRTKMDSNYSLEYPVSHFSVSMLPHRPSARQGLDTFLNL